jgi:hypothetical protein
MLKSSHGFAIDGCWRGWLGWHRPRGRANGADSRLGAVGRYAGLRDFTSLGGQLTVFALPGG